MNSKTILLLCTLASGMASSTFGMEKPHVLLRRTKSLPNLNSHKSKLIADAEAAKSSKKDRSCLETCCKTFKTFIKIKDRE